MAFVEVDGPGCGAPGADQYRTLRQREQMQQQFAADAGAARVRGDVGVAYQRHVPHVLDAHHAEQPVIPEPAMEAHAGGDFAAQFRFRHVRLAQTIVRHVAPIGARRVVDDGAQGGNVGCGAGDDHADSVLAAAAEPWNVVQKGQPPQDGARSGTGKPRALAAKGYPPRPSRAALRRSCSRWQSMQRFAVG